MTWGGCRKTIGPGADGHGGGHLPILDLDSIPAELAISGLGATTGAPAPALSADVGRIHGGLVRSQSLVAGIIKQLKAEGWAVLRQEGSHVRMGKGAARTTVPLHGKRDLKPGTLADIERQTGIKLR